MKRTRYRTPCDPYANKAEPQYGTILTLQCVQCIVFVVLKENNRNYFSVGPKVVNLSLVLALPCSFSGYQGCDH